MNKTIVFASMLVTLLLLLPVTDRSVWAQEPPAEDTEYTVVKGDNLTRIGRKHGVTVEDLFKANDLESDLIFPGMKLTIPGSSRVSAPDEPSTVSPTKPSVKTEEPQVSPAETEPLPEKPVTPEKPIAAKGKINFKWAFVGRIDPEGRNRIINIVDDPSKASSGSFSEGDKIALYIEPGEDTYVYIYLLDSRGNLRLIFPTKMDEGTLKSEFTSGKGTYIPDGDSEWFSLDENEGTETFYILATTKRLTKLEQLTRSYTDAEDEEQNLASRKVLDEIQETKRRLIAFGDPAKANYIGGRIRGIKINIAKEAVWQIEEGSFYSKTIKLKHE